MPTVIKSIGTAGRDYSTITAWEAAHTNAVYTSASTHAIGECYDDSVFDEAVTFSGAESNIIETTLTVASGERHDGTAGTGARHVQSVAARKFALNSDTVHKNILWLEFNLNDKGTTEQISLPGAGSHDTSASRRIRNILMHNQSGAPSLNGEFLRHVYDSPIEISNSVFYNFNVNFDGLYRPIYLADLQSAGQVIKFQNNTLYNFTNGSAGASAGMEMLFLEGASPATVQNNIAVTVSSAGSGSVLCYSNLSGTVDHNLSSDTSASGTGSLTSKSATNQFVSIVGGSEDLHLKAGADAIDAGTDLGTTPTGVNLDIDGYDRDAGGVTWDMGADELVALGHPARKRFSGARFANMNPIGVKGVQIA